MIGEASDSGFERFGQAGTPDMHEIRWERQHPAAGLHSTPKPTYVYIDHLYINWHVEGLQLTPLFVYHDALSYQQMMGSAGNGHLMYHPNRGWIPIAEHLHHSNPGLLLRNCHIVDYGSMWRRAEQVAQVKYGLRRHLFHDDPRLRELMLTGVMKPLHARQRRRLKRKRREFANQDVQPGQDEVSTVEGRTPIRLLEGCGVLPETSLIPGDSDETSTFGSEEECEAVQAPTDTGLMSPRTSSSEHPTTPKGDEMLEFDEDQSMLLTRPPDIPWSSGGHISLCWVLDEEGQLALTPASQGALGLPPPQKRLITARCKGARRTGGLERLEDRCTRCGTGMCPPSIRRCCKCHQHWFHSYCASLFLNAAGHTSLLCAGCSWFIQPKATRDSIQCRLCQHLVLDNNSAAACKICGAFSHILCTVAACPRSGPEFDSAFFSFQDYIPRLGHYAADRRVREWTCRGCRLPNSADHEVTPTSRALTLPHTRADGRPSIRVGDVFSLALSPNHHIAIQCHWELASLSSSRFSLRFKEVRQLHCTLFPDLDGDQVLTELSDSIQPQLLTLSTTTHGCQLLSYVVFAQTTGKGPPLILFQGVHPAVQRSGIGRWGLQLVYEQCGKTRDLLVKIHAGRMEFYSHLGFLPRMTTDNSRFPTIGAGTMRRAEVQGAPLGLTLAQAVTYAQLEFRLDYKWSHSESLGFTIPVGKDSCFALTALQLLASVPQFVEFFALYAGASTDTGTLVACCMAHLWANNQDPDGPAMVELLRGRLDASYGQSAPSRKRRGGMAAQGFMGQQDVEEILAAIQRELTEVRPSIAGDCSRESTAENGRAYTKLITSNMTVASRCAGCQSCKHTAETHSTFTVPLMDRPIRNIAQLLSPVLTLEWDRNPQTGCAGGCKGGLMSGTVHFNEAAPILHFQIMPGDCEGARNRTQVDLPLRFKLHIDSDTVQRYILRAVSFHSHSKSRFSGHFSAGRFVGRTLHHCSQLPSGAVRTTHKVADKRYFRLSELSPRLRDDYMVSSIFYSLVQPEEQGADTGLWWDAWTQWAEHQLPDERSGEAALHAGGPAARPSRSLLARRELVDILSEHVPPGQCLQVDRGADSVADHLSLVRLALSQAEESATPCFFWYQLPGQLVGAAMTGLAQDKEGVSLTRTSTATTGRGSTMSLSKVLQIIQSEQPGDPFTSVHARAGGLGSLYGGTEIMADIADNLQLEVTGGCSLLASGCGTVSKLHFHSLPVLNIYFFFFFWKAHL